MKKTTLWQAVALKMAMICTLMTCPIATKAQQVKFGVKGGVNLSTLSFENHDYDVHNKLGFFVGPTAKMPLPVKGLGLDASVLYDQRSGEAFLQIAGGRNYWTTIKRHHITVPINVRYDMGTRHFGFFVFAGPQVGFNVGGSEPTRMDYGDWEPRSVVFGMNAGLGIMIIDHLQLSANYNFVFKKDADISINRDNSAFQYVDTSKMNAWQLSLSYYF